MPAAPRAASRGPSIVCGPCKLRRVTMLALVPAASQAMRSMAAVISSDVFGLTTRMVGLSMLYPPANVSASGLDERYQRQHVRRAMWYIPSLPQHLSRQNRVL